jgi:hypothetical protein
MPTLNDKSMDLEQKMVVDQHQFLLELSGLRPFLGVIDKRLDEVKIQT